MRSKRVLKWIGCGLLGVLVLALGLVMGAWLLLRASLAEIDGRRGIAGLSAPVTIERDALGVPTITATNRADAACALGFVHAQERFFQMDGLRRFAAGEVGELVGASVVNWLDAPARKHRFRQRAQQAVAAASTEERAVLAAYTAGVNAGLAALGARPPEYLALRGRPAPWREEDTLLVALAMFKTLEDSSGSEDIARERLDHVLGPETYRFFTQMGSSWDAAVDDSVLSPVPVPPLGTVDFRPLTNPPSAKPPRKPAAAKDERKPLRPETLATCSRKHSLVKEGLDSCLRNGDMHFRSCQSGSGDVLCKIGESCLFRFPLRFVRFCWVIGTLLDTRRIVR